MGIMSQLACDCWCLDAPASYVEDGNWQRFTAMCFPLLWLADGQVDFTASKIQVVEGTWGSQTLMPQKVAGDFDASHPPQMNFIGIWHLMEVMSGWLVGGRWVGFQFVRWPHPPPLCGSVRRYVLSPSPLQSFPLIILSFLLLSALPPLTSPLSDLPSPLYPPLSAFIFPTPAPISRPKSVHARVKPAVRKAGTDGSSSLVWFRITLQYPSRPLGAAIAGVDGYTKGVWIHLPPQYLLRGSNKESQEPSLLLSLFPTSPFLPPPLFLWMLFSYHTTASVHFLSSLAHYLNV